jgi:(E)-4-hydroxy-3-methylbut-2-enyl-diphosphate synthase
MINRRKTKIVTVGSVKIGFSEPIVIQSMTKVPTTDIEKCVRQINQLAQAGCRLVRVAVPRRADTLSFAKIVQKVKIPLVADIHFSPERAIEAIEAGAAKIRLNPGNIKKQRDIERIIDAAKMHKIAVRIGVNEASIRDLKESDTPIDKRIDLMVKEMKKYVGVFEKRGFEKIVLSVKSSDCLRTIEANRKIAQVFDYPIHIGLTHAGLPEDAAIPSAVAIGSLLAEGIGDTVRVSAAGDPIEEVALAKQILEPLGLYHQRQKLLTVCPACGRAEVDVVKLARKIRQSLKKINKPVHIAVMGCVVNGPGEAADADLAVCGGKRKAVIYRKGQKKKIVPESRIIPALLKELESL